MADSEKQQQLPIEQQQPLAQEEQQDEGQQAQGKPAPPPKEIIGKRTNQFAFSFIQTHGKCYRNSNERNGGLYVKNVRVYVCVRVLKYTRAAILYVVHTYIYIYSHIRRLVRSRMWKAAQETKWKFYFLPVTQPTPAAPSYGWPNKCWQPNLLATVLAACSLHCSLSPFRLVYRCAHSLTQNESELCAFYIRVHVCVFIVLVTLFVYTVVWVPNRNFRHVKQAKERTLFW